MKMEVERIRLNGLSQKMAVMLLKRLGKRLCLLTSI
jgi:hypothetical protein